MKKMFRELQERHALRQYRRRMERRRAADSASIAQAQVQALEYAQRVAAGWSTGNVVTARFDKEGHRMGISSFIFAVDEAIRSVYSGKVL